jgi:site-specific recombinase XerD
VLRAAITAGVIGDSQDSYVIPMVRNQRRTGERDPRIVLYTVKRLAKRAGIGGHAHALRAAFAMQYLETHPGQREARQQLKGHEGGHNRDLSAEAEQRAGDGDRS